MLSRNPLPDELNAVDQFYSEELDSLVYSEAAFAAQECGEKLESIEKCTAMDEQLKVALEYTTNGWPNHSRDVSENMRVLFKERHHFSCSNGILLFCGRIVIPSVLRQPMLARIHEGHQGVKKCVDRARMCVWWPSIVKDIERCVSACAFCNQHKPSQRREPLMPTSLPERPWQRVSADFCDFEGKKYLVVCDSFSRWIEILNVSSTDTKSIVDKFKSIFVRYGNPDFLFTDNGPPYSSQAFSEFMRSIACTHTTSSPHFAQSNGSAERAVATAKRILAQPDVFSALLAYRSTPHSATGETPAKMLMGREIRTSLPSLPSMLNPEWPDFTAVRDRHEDYKRDMKQAYDKRHGVRPLPELQPGSRVRIKLDEEKTWSEPHTVVSRSSEPRSYIVRNDEGRLYRRNRKHLQEREKTCPAAASPSTPVYLPLPDCDTDEGETINGENENDGVMPRMSSRVKKQTEKYQAGFT